MPKAFSVPVSPHPVWLLRRLPKAVASAPGKRLVGRGGETWLDCYR
jgi:hypothetical protein